MSTATPTRTIVVGYDGSPAALSAVEHAIDRAIPNGRLVLVYAYQEPVDFIGAPRYEVMLEHANTHAGRVLDGLEDGCENLSTVEHDRDICVGSASAAIVRATEVHEADEIVIGSRGVGRVRAVLGSVAHDVLHHARCPVTVIPERMVESSTVTPATASGAV